MTFDREVEQLDFSDFVAKAALDREEVTAGAESLRPPATWSLSATVERRFWNDNVLTLTARHEWIDDVVDLVVLEQDGELFDAVGNIGAGSRRVFRAELTAPLARLGIDGMQLRAAATFLHSRVDDPVTKRRRIISEDRPFEGEVRLTHDLPGGRWSWGAKATLAYREREFRHDEERFEGSGTLVAAHVEYRPATDWRFRF